MQWDITDHVRVRSAFFRTVKPALVANQTIQPTQVAGFNQFYNDFNGTEAWFYGVGLDIRLADTVYAGTELMHRELDSPFFDRYPDVSRTADADEREFRTYIYWTPNAEVAVNAELQLVSFDDDEATAIPSQIGTLTIPLELRYFSPSGVFAGIGGTFVRQDVNRLSGTATNEGSENFFLVDGAIGYRFPQRRGQISLEIRNIFDANFSYQDDNFRTPTNEL